MTEHALHHGWLLATFSWSIKAFLPTTDPLWKVGVSGAGKCFTDRPHFLPTDGLLLCLFLIKKGSGPDLIPWPRSDHAHILIATT
jgi:hypothetical protein